MNSQNPTLKGEKSIERSLDKSFTPVRAKQNKTRPRRLHFHTILVAALVMLLATVSVIAITKPHIYYVIREKKDSWRITFTQKDSSDEVSLIPIIPTIPDGFDIIEEESTETNFFLVMEDKDEHLIIFEQMLPDGTAVNIDSERNENTVEIINETEVICYREGEATILLLDDGRYMYHIRGNISKQLLKDMAASILN